MDSVDRRSFAGFLVLGAALMAGFAADLLFHGAAWGINVVLWTALLLSGVHLALKNHDRGGLRRHKLLTILALFFALLFAWRDSAILKLLDGLALLTLLGLILARGRFEWEPWSSFTGVCVRLGRVVQALLLGAVPVIKKDIDWEPLKRDTSLTAFKAVGRGLLIALPIAGLFTILLCSADARFERLLNGLVDFDGGWMIERVLVVLICAWLVSGYLREASQKGTIRVADRPYPLALGIVEIGIVLGAIDLLFAAFVSLQVPYLFGGATHVAATTGITFAEYARRGFFELAAVAGLALPLLLHAHAMIRAAGRGGENVYRYLAGGMVLLIFVIIASAVHRMGLYREHFGLTELRFYTTAFMCWLTVVFGWFLITVLMGMRDRFALGALASGLALIPILHVVNPDAQIFRVNSARASEGKPFDPHYNASLSADAMPEVVRALSPPGAPGDRKIVTEAYRRAARDWMRDWRGWSWSRAQGARLAGRLGILTLKRPGGPPANGQPALPFVVPIPTEAPIVHVPYTWEDQEKFRALRRNPRPEWAVPPR